MWEYLMKTIKKFSWFLSNPQADFNGVQLLVKVICQSEQFMMLIMP